MNFHAFIAPFLRYFRKRRMLLFFRCFPRKRVRTLLDVGGTAFIWNMYRDYAEVTIVNVSLPDNSLLGYRWVQGDGKNLPFSNGAFDLVFSNSVIEHVGVLDDQRRFAQELRRVGKYVFCQTPYKWFPIEPHFIVPFIHWIPVKWPYLVLRWATIRGLVSGFDSKSALNIRDHIRLIDLKEMRALFPDCEIIKERFCGLTKSLIAIRSSVRSDMAV
jgi:hypothetical protein